MNKGRHTYWLIVQLLAIGAGIYGVVLLFEAVTT